ncbi:MAG TPA: papain-like cysteine protease family protein [Terriglobales bacterium]|nr:papain-like cysteine protease family protein [Terriglobales bacterium]
MPQLAQIVTQQQCELWCWAACISMMFDFYGHPLTQAEIVLATYGNVVCLPAGSSTTIGRDLSRPWIDDNGIPFLSQITAAYDFFNGINFFDNNMVVSQLSSNNPLLYCNTHHAMVVYAVDYIPTAGEPNVVAVHVVDPWPFSPQTHLLTAPEMVPANLGGEMTFLASVHLT